ncbi:MAG TPA: hypothetical protein VGF87_10855, partial [Acidimicrobiales bacterium]
FALQGIVAHFSHANALGVFAIITSTYIIGQGITRSCTSDCMLTRHETDDAAMRPYEQGGYLSAFIVSCGVAALIALSTLLLHHQFMGPMLVLAIFLPVGALQDYARYIGLSRHDPGYSVRLDAAWLFLFLAAFAVEKHYHHQSLTWLVGAWISTGALVGLWTIHQHLTTKGVRPLLRFWVKSEGSIGWKFAGQFLLSQGWPYFIFFLLAFVLSVGDIGIFKLGQLAMGPLSVASVGLQSAMIAMTAKRFPYEPMKTLRFIFYMATGTAAVTAAWMFLVYYLPVHVMTTVLGPTWPQARHIVIYCGLMYIIASWTGAGAAGLRGLRAAKENLWLAIVMLPFLLVPAIIGAKIDGLVGACIGAVISNVFNAVFTWVVLIWAARRVEVQEEPPGPPDEIQMLEPTIVLPPSV